MLRAGDAEAARPHTAELAEALDAGREVRARLSDLSLVDPRNADGLWQLHGWLLAAVERVLVELDLEQLGRNRARRWQEAATAQARRGSQAAQRLRASTRRVVDRPQMRRRRR